MTTITRRRARMFLLLVAMSVCYLVPRDAEANPLVLAAPLLVGHPSLRVSANTQIEVKFITDVAWYAKVEVFTTNTVGDPVLTKEDLDSGLNRVAATQHVIDIAVGPVLAPDTY